MVTGDGDAGSVKMGEYGRASYGGANNLTDLNRKIRETCYVRREKMDVLKELPPKMRSDIWVNMSPLARAHYESAKRDIISYLRDVLGRGNAARNAARAEILVKLNMLRQIVGNAKIEIATKWVLDFLESTNRQLVVFAQHQKVQNDIAKALTEAGVKVVRIEGGQDANKRDQAVKAFQAGEAQVIVCSVRAGGTGLTPTGTRSGSACQPSPTSCSQIAMMRARHTVVGSA
jgi:SWI/SNF-related matrix-associated actin-dependent regulator 1 of chromatin subfamily A